MFEKLDAARSELAGLVARAARNRAGRQACLELFARYRAVLDLERGLRRRISPALEAAGSGLLAPGLPLGLALPLVCAREKAQDAFASCRHVPAALAALLERAGLPEQALAVCADMLRHRPQDEATHARLAAWSGPGRAEALALSAGRRLALRATLGQGVLAAPHSVCAPPGQRRIYVSQSLFGDSAVHALDREGAHLGTLPLSLTMAASLCPGEPGQLWVCDQAGHALLCVDSAGGLLRRIDLKRLLAARTDRFYPFSACLHQGRLFVCAIDDPSAHSLLVSLAPEDPEATLRIHHDLSAGGARCVRSLGAELALVTESPPAVLACDPDTGARRTLLERLDGVLFQLAPCGDALFASSPMALTKVGPGGEVLFQAHVPDLTGTPQSSFLGLFCAPGQDGAELYAVDRTRQCLQVYSA